MPDDVGLTLLVDIVTRYIDIVFQSKIWEGETEAGLAVLGLRT